MSFETDVKLMLRASKGDAEAYSRLYNKHFWTVVCFVRRHNGHLRSADDIAQETFSKIWEKREHYRPGAGFKTYLLTFARYIMLEHQRRHRYERSMLSGRAEGIRSQQACRDEAGMSPGQQEIVAIAKRRLSKKHLQAIELVFFSDIPNTPGSQTGRLFL